MINNKLYWDSTYKCVSKIPSFPLFEIEPGDEIVFKAEYGTSITETIVFVLNGRIYGKDVSGYRYLIPTDNVITILKQQPKGDKMETKSHNPKPVVKQAKFYSVFSKDDRILLGTFDSEEQAVEMVTDKLKKYPQGEYLIAVSYKLVKLAEQPLVVTEL